VSKDNEMLPLGDFDREFTLKELLSTINNENLISAIKIILKCDFCITSNNSESIIGQAVTGPLKKTPLCPELEPLGYLITNETIDDKLLLSVKKMMEIILKSSVRYLMASDLHLETVQTDYKNLKQEHKALMESEARYKDLAENLEQRVAEQVETIDQAQRQLYQAEKLASVGQLAAGIAHEINNPLGFIQSNLSTSKSYVVDFLSFSEKLKIENNVSILRESWNELNLDYTIEDFQDLLDESIHGVQRVSKIVSDLKEFSSVDQSKEEIVDINNHIRSACNIAQIEITKKAQLIQNLAELPKIKCQSGQLSQVFLNILLNAEQIIDDDGEITVTSCVSDEGKIIVEITDNGPGIPDKILKRVFDPFYTTRDVGEGTGLGLTVSRDIIMNHDGVIEIQSAVNKGTTVRIILPVKI
jgi:two-component system, NtrC family, sensor kinase